MNRLLFSTSACMFLASISVGCGGGSAHPDLIPVTGTVTYNGDPVAGAEVSFFKQGAPRAASDVTNAEGEFTLSMFEPGDGAMAGENVITVVKMDGAQAAVKSNDVMTPPDPLQLASKGAEGMSGAGSSGPKYLVPEKYAQQGTTPLKEDISAANNKIPIKLVD